MVKKITTLNIDDEILNKAKKKIYNLSATVEEFLAKKTKQEIVKQNPICDKCGKKENKACKENNYIGMHWLCPDECWICQICLNTEVKKIITAVR